jgi:hypothetical protein
VAVKVHPPRVLSATALPSTRPSMENVTRAPGSAVPPADTVELGEVHPNVGGGGGEVGDVCAIACFEGIVSPVKKHTPAQTSVRQRIVVCMAGIVDKQA